MSEGSKWNAEACKKIQSQIKEKDKNYVIEIAKLEDFDAIVKHV